MALDAIDWIDIETVVGDDFSVIAAESNEPRADGGFHLLQSNRSARGDEFVDSLASNQRRAEVSRGKLLDSIA